MLGLLLIALISVATTAPVDSVEGLERAYHAAVDAGDGEALKRLHLATTAGEKAMVELRVNNELAGMRLRRAQEAEFGIKLEGGGIYMPRKGDWVVKRDRAEVRHKEGVVPEYPPVVRTKEGLKIDLWSWGQYWTQEPDGKEAAEKQKVVGSQMVSLDRKTKRVKEHIYWSMDDMVDWDRQKPPHNAKVEADRPATRPVKIDSSSPEAAYETLAEAMVMGDAGAYLAITELVDPKDAKGVKFAVDWLITSGRLHAAAVKRFGAAGWRLAGGLDPHRPGLQLLNELDEAAAMGKIQVHGDDAKFGNDLDISYGPGEMVRVKPQWKIPSRKKEEVGKVPEEGEDPSGIDAAIAILMKIEAGIAKRIESGEFKTIEEAEKALEVELKRPGVEGTVG
jgi:hypothetical protein